MIDTTVGEFSYDPKLLYDALIRSTDEFIYICNMKTGVFRYTAVMVKEFNLPGEVIKDPLPYWKEIVHPDDWDRFYQSNISIGENGNDNHLVEFRALSREGEYQWLKCRGYLVRDEEGEPAVFAGVLSKLDRKPRIDKLTSLYTSSVLAEDFAKMIEENRFGEIGLFLFGMDKFRQINECYGRDEGDKVLKAAAKVLLELIPEGIRVYRLEGDQFGVLVKYPTEDNIRRLYQAIRSRFQCYRGQGDTRRLSMTVSAGYAEYPKDAGVYMDLYKYADYALQYAKEQGRDHLEIFTKDILVHKSRKLKLLGLLREDVSNGFRGFSLVYQPMVDGRTKEIRAVEALVRWENEQIGEVKPKEFIPLMEENRLLNPLGRWMFQNGCAALKGWSREGLNLSMHLNVSQSQISDRQYIEEVTSVIDWTGIARDKIVIEVVESSSVNNIQKFEEGFRDVKNRGMKLMFDDFGTDYASIGLLKSELVDIVKIDPTIVREMMNDRFNLEFVRFVSNICRDMNVEICLEGITEMEMLEELEALETVSFDYLQGELFGKPQKEEQILLEWKL